MDAFLTNSRPDRVFFLDSRVSISPSCLNRRQMISWDWLLSHHAVTLLRGKRNA